MARRRAIPEQSGYTILVVDDQESTLTSVRVILEREGHEVLLADSGVRALELFVAHRVDLLLVDYFMPKMTGEELVGRIRALDGDVQIVLQTGYSGEKPPREMLRALDIQGYHDKTEGPDKLLLWVAISLKACEHIRQLRAVEQLKSQLLANISHEFRTPLNVILGYTELLEQELSDNASAADTLARVRTNAQTLFRMIDDFLRLADLDAASSPPRNLEPTAVDVIRRDADLFAADMTRQKPVVLAWQVPEGIAPIAADRSMLRVILRNLLSNAFKFTERGSVTITATESAAAVTFSIADTGPGIPESDQEQIFDPFHQVNGSDTRSHEGTGIGLTIARKLARLMGGDVTVASRPHAGATFQLQMPRVNPSPRATSADTAPPEPGTVAL